MPSKRLGKGLDALFGDQLPLTSETTDGKPLMLPIQKVEPNAAQPRRIYDDTELQELADSLMQHGMIQPITVRLLENGYYQIIAGERRWRAARLAGMKEIPVYVIAADEQKTMELALIENLQRSDLNALEEAGGYQTLIERYGLTQETVAERVGKSRVTVTNALRLLNLSDRPMQMLREGLLTAGHARALLSLKDEKQQSAAAEQIVRLQMSVRQAESFCRNLQKKKTTKAVQQRDNVDYVAECAKELSAQLGRKVNIVAGKRKGRLELEFYGEEDLQRLYEWLRMLPTTEEKEK